MFCAPFGDVFVVAREKDIWHFHATKIGGFGVLGIFEVVTIRERLDGGASFTAENTGDETGDRVNDTESGQFPTGEDEVAKRDFVVDKSEDALVVAFVMGTEDDIVFIFDLLSELASKGLVPSCANRGGEDGLGIRVFRFDFFDGGENWLGTE